MVKGVNRGRAVGCTVRSGWLCLGVLLASFSVGVLCGTSIAIFSDPSPEFSDCVRQYCAAFSGSQPYAPFVSVVWDCIRWPLLVSVLGVTAIGIVGIPILFAVRGFLLSFSTAMFVILLGPNGIAIAAVLFAVAVLFVLPAMFILGCSGIHAACLRLPNAIPAPGKRGQLEACLVCFGILAVSAAVQWTVIPVVLNVVCSRLMF